MGIVRFSWGLIVFLTFVFIVFINPLGSDGDFYHHLSIGKFILENHYLPTTDQFTFTAFRQPFIAHSWLSGVLFELIFRNFGAAGISLLVASVATLTFFLLYLLLLSYKLNKKIIYLSLTLAVSLIATRFPNRPEIWIYSLVLSLLLIDRFKEAKPKSVLLYPIIIALWANLYGSSVILGLGILILLFFKQLVLDKYKIKHGHYLFYLSILASFITSLINGYGMTTVFYIYFIPQIAGHEGEWAGIFETLTKAPASLLYQFQATAIIYFMYLALFALVFFISIKKVKQFLFPLVLALAIFIPLKATRQIPLATILSIPLFAQLLNIQTGKQRQILIILTVVVSLISLCISILINPIRLGTEDKSQKQLIDFMKTNHLSGKALNGQQLGGLLTYYLYPNILVAYDTRDEVFVNTSIPKDYIRLPLNLLVNKYQADYLVVNYQDNEAKYQNFFASTRWRPIFKNNTYLIAAPQPSSGF